MRIAIYDDIFLNIKQIKNAIYNFSNYKKMDIVVDIIDKNIDPSTIKETYALIFISFQNENNKNFAQQLFKNKSQIPIIVFSENLCHAADAFKINAYNFLHIPLCEELLFTILEEFFSSFLSAPLILSDGFENVCINCNEILYLEADNKHCCIHLINQSLYCNKTMARVFEALPQGQFLKISRSFIVNSDYITRFCSEYIILTNGEVLYPSRHFYKSFKVNYTALKTPIIP